MIDDMMKDEYNAYLDKHITAVKNAFDWICINLPELVEFYDADALGKHICTHDLSKYDAEEYLAYCEYFYGERTPELKLEFDYAWLHHQHNNSHHWQHWVLREDSGNLKVLEMPYLDVLEMVCDHWAFSWVKGNLYEIFDWYKVNSGKMLLHKDTKELYESILDKIKQKLNEI